MHLLNFTSFNLTYHSLEYDSQSVMLKATDGADEGDAECNEDGRTDGDALGPKDGTLDGDVVGNEDGIAVGATVGNTLGPREGLADG